MEAYLDTTDATLTVVTRTGRTVKTVAVPEQVQADVKRQAAWARNVLRRAGFTPDPTVVRPYPYGLAIPLG